MKAIKETIAYGIVLAIPRFIGSYCSVNKNTIYNIIMCCTPRSFSILQILKRSECQASGSQMMYMDKVQIRSRYFYKSSLIYYCGEISSILS